LAPDGIANRLRPLAERILGSGPPLRIRAWDGSEIGPAGAPAVVIRDRRALRRLLWKPGETGLARAYLAGEIDVDGDLVTVLGTLFDIARRGGDGAIRLTPREQSEIVRTAVTLGAVGPEPAPPEDEGLLSVLRYGPAGDGGLTAHLRMPTAFYARLLGEPMTYSAAHWPDGPDGPDGADGLAAAQSATFTEIGRELGLGPGARVLDLGCGWGELAVHLARTFGAHAVGVTPVAEHADRARDRAAAAGAAAHAEFRTGEMADAAEVAGDLAPYDAVVSVGGAAEYADGAAFARTVRDLLRPGGALLLARLAGTRPDGPMESLGTVISELESAGLDIGRVTGAREDYVRTIRHWTANLTDGAAAPPSGPVRARLLVLAGTAVGLGAGRLSAYRISATRRANAAFG
jgi:cyclopropane-fatty-acyl-phospholipid synthase